ncbi:BBM_1a_G0010180.mRNA.1.CDS.1 [Saccharomyces cerevisiae]|nr:ADE_G0010120.mRNA.1.CDS.1 [Saccharomyces cerevisiae]CAI4350965.1 BBM_1a_G0010180.mRNA.1.CDS.1 [Saccharomyces cerevisiae]CAI5318803.1 ALI_HP2_G0030190.mRNA.1.CDS.1 [Saccharomyces cerevisiae]CAI6437567.1 ALI_HP1_G0010700.mRNA.1.CDS.1 [Saccharomyces cerevisiae]CAI6559292.1 ADE_G0010120.mRNA.1.CDS.1 [Saccharomyces cerevisiae]
MSLKQMQSQRFSATSRVRMLLIGASGLRSSSSKLECPQILKQARQKLKYGQNYEPFCGIFVEIGPQDSMMKNVGMLYKTTVICMNWLLV